MDDCLFCKIANKEFKSDMVYEDELVCAFNDINKKAPIHILIVPKKHFDSINGTEKYPDILSSMCKAANKIAEQKGLSENGFRLVINTGKDGGQTVNHLHMHLLGGRKMEWPPG